MVKQLILEPISKPAVFGQSQTFWLKAFDDATVAQILFQSLFQYTTDTNGNMTLVNEGRGDDAELHTGRALELVDSVNELAIPTQISGYITYHNIDTNTIMQETTDGTDKIFTDITVNNILVHLEQFNTQSLANIQANPNLLAKLADSPTGTIDEVNITLGVDDAYYPCAEISGQYIVDSISIGAEKVENGTFDTDVSHWNDGRVNITWVGGTMKVEVINPNGYAKSDTFSVEAGKTYFFSVELVEAIFIGNGIRFLIYDGTTIFSDNNLIRTEGTYNYLFTAPTTSSTVMVWVGKSGNTQNEVFRVDNVSIREVTAQEISNYTEFVRLNADYNPIGLQTMCLELDANGVMTGYTESILKHHDKQDIVIPLDTPYTYTTTKDIKKIDGDGTTATITHDDDTTTIIP